MPGSAIRAWAAKLEVKPKYVASSTRTDFPWTNSHHLAGDLGASVLALKDATPAGVLLGSGQLAAALDRLDLIDEYQFLVHPRLVGHGPTLYQGGLPRPRRLDLVAAMAQSVTCLSSNPKVRVRLRAWDKTVSSWRHLKAAIPKYFSAAFG